MKNSYEKYEESIDISRVLLFCGTQWKSVLIVGVIGLIIGTLYAVLNVGSVPKYLVLGFVAGCIISCVVWAVIFVFSGRLFSVSNVEQYFDIRLLGSSYDFSELKTFDKKIATKLAGIYSEYSIEKQNEILIFNINNLLRNKKDIKRIFLISSLGNELKCADALKEGLMKDGHIVEGCADIVGNVDLMKKIADDDVVIILEHEKLSKKSLIEVEMTTLRNITDNILGMVVAGGKK